MKLNVTVKMESKNTSRVYHEIELDEGDIRDLAEKKADKLFALEPGGTFEAQEIELHARSNRGADL